MNFFKTFFACIMAFCFFLAPNSTSLAKAENFPTRPITVIIPFDAGGAVDPVMRIIGDYLQKKYDITMVIINKPTGGGVAAMLDVLRARPDGYTIGFTSTNILTVLPEYKNVGFKYTDLKHVAQIITLTMGYAVHKDSGITSLSELMQKAEKEKGVHALASPGSFTAQRLFHSKVMENYPNADLPYVPYEGSGAVTVALLGKHVTVGYMPTVAYMNQQDLRTIAISSLERDPVMPDVPTFVELLDSEYVYNSACGIVAPKKMPANIVKRYEELFTEALQNSDVQKKLANIGAKPDFLNSKDFTKILDTYAEFFAKPIQEAKNSSAKK